MGDQHLAQTPGRIASLTKAAETTANCEGALEAAISFLVLSNFCTSNGLDSPIRMPNSRFQGSSQCAQNLISEADTRLRTTLRGRRMVTSYSEETSGRIGAADADHPPRERAMDTRKRRKDRSASPQLEPIAGNGLLDRRALLGRGIAFASAATTGVGTSLATAAAEPLTNGPWSLAPGVPVPPYGQPSKFEQKVVRTLSNPKLEARGSAARTPHHLLNGTITPNGLHFVVARGGVTRRSIRRSTACDPWAW